MQLTVRYRSHFLDMHSLAEDDGESTDDVSLRSQEGPPRTHLHVVDICRQFVQHSQGQKAEHQAQGHVFEIHKLAIALREKHLTCWKFRHRTAIVMIDDCSWNEPAIVSPQLGTKTEVDVLRCHEEIVVQEAYVLEHPAPIGSCSCTGAENQSRLRPDRRIYFTASQIDREAD